MHRQLLGVPSANLKALHWEHEPSETFVRRIRSCPHPVEHEISPNSSTPAAGMCMSSHSTSLQLNSSRLRTASRPHCSLVSGRSPRLHIVQPLTNSVPLQNVTLGGTGKEVGDRHPKIARNVLIGAGASILGNIPVDEGAQVAAGSLVLKPVQAHTMVAGSPAKEVGLVSGNPAASLKQWSEDCPLEEVTRPTAGATHPAASAAAQRLPKSRLTGTGGSVRVYSEADYYRHVDAEKHLLNKDPSYGVADLPDDWRVASASSGDDNSKPDPHEKGPVRQESFTEYDDVRPVAATTSDADAEHMWGNHQKEPEFYI